MRSDISPSQIAGATRNATWRTSTANGSTDNLTNGSTFTGTWESVEGYGEINIVITAEPSTVGLTIYVDTSWDEGSTTEKSIPRSYRAATTGALPIRLGVAQPYARLRVVNDGGVDTTTLKIRTSYNNGGEFQGPLNGTLYRENPAGTVRLGNDIDSDVSRGLHYDAMSVHKFGGSAAVSTTERFLWPGAATSYPGFLQAAKAMRVKAGGNVNDTAAGSGAREVTIYGIDENGNPAEEAVATAGASASSATTTTFFRVHRARVTAAGTYGGNNPSAITIEASDGSADVSIIAAGAGTSEQCNYTIPAGYTGLWRGYECNVAGSKPATLRAYSRAGVNVVSAPFGPLIRRLQRYELNNLTSVTWRSPVVLPEWTDLWFTGAKAAGGSDSLMNLSFDITLYRD